MTIGVGIMPVVMVGMLTVVVADTICKQKKIKRMHHGVYKFYKPEGPRL